jgi:hypothetical protein
VLLSEAQWCFSACGEAIMSNEMTESDSERGKMGSSLRKKGQTITEIVSDIPEMVGHITEVVSDITEMAGHITESVGESTEIRHILITSSRKSVSVNQQLQASVHWILRK